MYKDENTLDNRVAQFERDQKTVSVPKKKGRRPTSLPPSSGNPYIQARHEVLSKYSEWRRNEIAVMEKTGNIDNRYYNDFVHEVAILGDKLSEKKN
jgi:hypothetical protein